MQIDPDGFTLFRPKNVRMQRLVAQSPCWVRHKFLLAFLLLTIDTIQILEHKRYRKTSPIAGNEI